MAVDLSQLVQDAARNTGRPDFGYLAHLLAGIQEQGAEPGGAATPGNGAMQTRNVEVSRDLANEE